MPKLLSATQQDVFTVEQVIRSERQFGLVDAVAIYVDPTLRDSSFGVLSALTQAGFHEAVDYGHLGCWGLGGRDFPADEFKG